MGDEKSYMRKLRQILRDIQRDIKAKYTTDTVKFGHRIGYLLSQWSEKLDRLAPKIAKLFVEKQYSNYDRRFHQELRKAGFTVKFGITEEQEKILYGAIQENVSLIKSIGTEHLEKVQYAVWNSVSSGYDLKQLNDALKEIDGVSDRRAELIARTESAKAHAKIEQMKRKQAGITQAVWLHSHAGKVPRPSHVRANGKLFDPEKGMYIDGKWILPGEEINCFPGNSVVKSPSLCKKLWRRRYTGELTEIITNSGEVINATRNHPILTNRGWVAIKDIRPGDNVVKDFNQSVNLGEANVKSSVATFSQVFDATSFLIGATTLRSPGFKFHGDISDSEVDTVNATGFLPSEINTVILKKAFELFFTKSNPIFISGSLNTKASLFPALSALSFAPESIVGFFCSIFSLLKSHSPHANDICFRLTSDFNSCLNEAISNQAPADIKVFGNLKLAKSGFVLGDNFVIGELLEILCSAWNNEAPSSDIFSDQLRVKSNYLRSLNNSQTLINYQFDSVVSVRNFHSSVHVYNLENEKNWYFVENIIAHNCRCLSRSIVDLSKIK